MLETQSRAPRSNSVLGLLDLCPVGAQAWRESWEDASEKLQHFIWP